MFLVVAIEVEKRRSGKNGKNGKNGLPRLFGRKWISAGKWQEMDFRVFLVNPLLLKRYFLFSKTQFKSKQLLFFTVE